MNEACRTVSVDKPCGMSVQFTAGLFQFMALLWGKKLTDGCRCALQCSHPYVSEWMKHTITLTALATPSAQSWRFSVTLLQAFRPWNVSCPAVHGAQALRHNSLCKPTGMHFFFFFFNQHRSTRTLLTRVASEQTLAAVQTGVAGLTSAFRCWWKLEKTARIQLFEQPLGGDSQQRFWAWGLKKKKPAQQRHIYCVGVVPFCIVLVLFFMLLLVWRCCGIFSSLMCCLCIALMVYIYANSCVFCSFFVNFF